MKQYVNWLNKNNYSPNTIRTYSSVLNKFENKMSDIRLIKKEILKSKKSPNTCILHYNVIFAYMKWTNDRRVKELQSLKLPQTPIIYREVFTKSFLYKKTEILENDNELMIKKKMTIRFLFETGIRANEIKNIKKINKKYIIISGKGKKERSVFYNQETFKCFYPFEFTTKTLRLWVKEILGKKYTPHSIRRSFATYLLLKGASPKMVQLQMGHSKIETTFSYLNLSLNENSKIYNRYF